VTAGENHTCGIGLDGAVVCWGRNLDYYGNFVGQATPPEGTFRSVDAGMQHTCGLRADGAVACWGSNETHNGEFAGQSEPPPGEYLSITVADHHGCAEQADGNLLCWGYVGNVFDFQAPAEQFRAISSGGEFTCGIRLDDGVRCWAGGDAFVMPAR